MDDLSAVSNTALITLKTRVIETEKNNSVIQDTLNISKFSDIWFSGKIGGIGAGAINKLNGMGIRVYKASKSIVRDNIGLFESNTMSEITVEHACGSHAGGCGHK